MKEQPDGINSPLVNIVIVLLHYGAKDYIDQSATGWRSIKCPFHNDATASGRVNVELGVFKCHACKVSGDGIKIIEMKEGIGFEGAIEFTRSVLGQSIQDVSHATKKGSPRKSRKPRRFISV